MLEQYRVTILAGLKLVRKSDIPATAIISIVPGKCIHIGIYGNIIDIARTMGIYFQLSTVRPHPHYTPSKHGQLFTITVYRIMKPKITYSYIYPAVNTHSYSIRSMVCAPAAQIVGITYMLNKGA